MYRQPADRDCEMLDPRARDPKRDEEAPQLHKRISRAAARSSISGCADPATHSTSRMETANGKGRGMPASALLFRLNYGQDTKAPRAAVNVRGAREDARAVRQAAAPLAAGDRECRARRHAHARGRTRSRAPRPNTASIRAPSSNWAALRCARQAAADTRPSRATISFASLVVPVHGGRIEVAVRGSRAASEIVKARNCAARVPCHRRRYETAQAAQDQGSRRVRPRGAVPDG